MLEFLEATHQTGSSGPCLEAFIVQTYGQEPPHYAIPCVPSSMTNTFFRVPCLEASLFDKSFLSISTCIQVGMQILGAVNYPLARDIRDTMLTGGSVLSIGTCIRYIRSNTWKTMLGGVHCTNIRAGASTLCMPCILPIAISQVRVQMTNSLLTQFCKLWGVHGTRVRIRAIWAIEVRKRSPSGICVQSPSPVDTFMVFHQVVCVPSLGHFASKPRGRFVCRPLWMLTFFPQSNGSCLCPVPLGEIIKSYPLKFRCVSLVLWDLLK